MTYVTAKARVLLASNRVHDLVLTADGAVSAKVLGENGIYEVRRRPSGVWSCQCAGWWWRLECSHVLAVARLAVAEGNRRALRS